ncbi:hypothetical protein CRE_11659 [Caenorhabditis remanei]|uniref:Uncharacterized protein n=1 Tax=Caenorhabditis remanei TaxID=31234 RepID=E3NWW3_CAERE|nr:hypothetical protein CRE_11659 [Caenorhabditis remanei]
MSIFAALQPSDPPAASPNSRSMRRNQRRVTRDEDRYHSEIRVEAVHQALAEYSDGRKLGQQPVKPHRRNGTSVSRSNTQKSKRSILNGGGRMMSGKNNLGYYEKNREFGGKMGGLFGILMQFPKF